MLGFLRTNIDIRNASRPRGTTILNHSDRDNNPSTGTSARWNALRPRLGAHAGEIAETLDTLVPVQAQENVSAHFAYCIKFDE